MITITKKATDVTRETKSNEAGLCSFANVQAGAYGGKANSQGFRTVTGTGVIAIRTRESGW